jgi:dTDP-4-amino-4,6-dideoxygalactose transaminase
LKNTFRPVGNSIDLKLSRFDGEEFSPFRPRLYQSGTAALSAAILACVNLSDHRAQDTEIIIPAYACPDLVSAILYAGAKPVLVDLEPNSPQLSISQLKGSITENTVAVIAVNFLGLQEKATQLRQICSDHGIFLIVDSAQWFPKSINTQSWVGDFNVISFGRGKPVNLLAGGAVLTTQAAYHDSLLNIKQQSSGFIRQTLKFLKIIFFNLAIHPRFYGIFIRFPGLNVGDTVYKPLTKISAMDSLHRGLIKSNIRKYQHQNSCSWKIHKKLATISNRYLIDLLPDESTEYSSVLLRYPILIRDTAIKDEFLRQTKDFGVSVFYPRPLNEIPGLEGILQSQAFPNASEFADYLVTLPTHEHVDDELIDRIMDILKQVLNRRS